MVKIGDYKGKSVRVKSKSKPIWKPKIRAKIRQAKEKRWVKVKKTKLTSPTAPRRSIVIRGATVQKQVTPKVTKLTKLRLFFGHTEIGVVLAIQGNEIVSRIVHQTSRELSRLKEHVNVNYLGTYTDWMNILQGGGN